MNKAERLPRRNGYMKPIDMVIEAAIAVLGITGDTPEEIKNALLAKLDHQCEARTQEFFNLGQKKLDELCELVMSAASHCGTAWNEEVINFVVSQLQQDGSRNREDALQFVRDFVAELPWQLGWRAELVCAKASFCPLRQMLGDECPTNSLEANGELVVTTESYRLKAKLERREQNDGDDRHPFDQIPPEIGLLASILGGMNGGPFGMHGRSMMDEMNEMNIGAEMPHSIREMLNRM